MFGLFSEHMFAKVLIVLLLATLAVGVAVRSSHGAGPERTIVVKPTDTLWSIAARSYGGDVREGVWKLEQRNHLGSATIYPGEVLVVPGG
jgi:LysM repeat protein